ncbi:MAG: putative DCC family thiol-disulfide oxidoreductase YuxK [Candidatus Azotimanducaceae bacterium]|jgi:predicted DCC family thiol-disulfide oxidoreductase YuxK
MENNKDTLYYDGQCPLCSREMDVLAKMKSDDLNLVDIHQLSAVDVPPRNEMLEVLHLKTRNGEWITGVDASVQAWSSTRMGWLWKLLKLPIINQVAKYVYAVWAKRRYAKLYGKN